MSNHVGRHTFANITWDCRSGSDPKQVRSTESAILVVLMDLRHELQQLNDLLYCDNFIRIPHLLRELKPRTPKKRKRKPKVEATR